MPRRFLFGLHDQMVIVILLTGAGATADSESQLACCTPPIR